MDKKISGKTVAAIGIFDGVHKGHQFLIKQMVKCARRRKLPSLVVTFHPHPVEVLKKHKFTYVVPIKYRIQLIKSLGVDSVQVIRFTKTFSRISPEQFIKDYLVSKFKIAEVFVGDDFRFGENRSGDVHDFVQIGKEYGIKVNHLKPVQKTNEKISSTLLRKYISEGSLDEATSLLGRPVSVLGPIIRGDGRGKKIGFPTANVNVDCGLLPPKGVYIVFATISNKRYSAIANVGVRPSFKGQDSKLKLEVHILDFKKNVYNCEVIVEFVKKIRNEKKFPSVETLTDQIKRDECFARAYFASSFQA